MGSAVQMHESRENRGTWAEQSIDRWYLGTSLKHYQCQIIHVKKQRAKEYQTKYFRNTHGMQQIGRLKMIDKLLNKIPSNLKEMSDPSMNTTLPRVEDIRPGITPKNLSISSSKHRRHTRTNIGASSKGAKRK